jgi:hypothetical protein
VVAAGASAVSGVAGSGFEQAVINAAVIAMVIRELGHDFIIDYSPLVIFIQACLSGLEPHLLA